MMVANQISEGVRNRFLFRLSFSTRGSVVVGPFTTISHPNCSLKMGMHVSRRLRIGVARWILCKILPLRHNVQDFRACIIHVMSSLKSRSPCFGIKYSLHLWHLWQCLDTQLSVSFRAIEWFATHFWMSQIGIWRIGYFIRRCHHFKLLLINQKEHNYVSNQEFIIIIILFLFLFFIFLKFYCEHRKKFCSPKEGAREQDTKTPRQTTTTF